METKFRRNTKQRQAILAELCARKTHPTANELFHAVRDRLPRISLGTVYRNLEVLAETGQVMKMRDGGQETRYDGNPLPHAHLRCSSCGRLFDLEMSAPDLDRLVGTEISGCLVTAVTVTLDGICTPCRSRS